MSTRRTLFNDKQRKKGQKVEQESKELGEIAQINLGQSPKSKYYNEKEEGLPFAQGSKKFGNKYPSFKKYCSKPKRVADKGDILISVRAPVGPVNVAPEKMCIGRGVTALKMQEGPNEFLYYYLKYFKNRWSQLSDGTTFKSITKPDLQNLEIPYPPKQVRQEIVDMLSPLDSKIENNDSINHLLQQVYQSIFESWFLSNKTGDDHIAVEDLVKYCNNRIKPETKPEKEFSLFSFSSYDESMHPDKKKGANINSQKYRVSDNQILVSKLNPRFCRIWNLEDVPENSICSTEFVVLQPTRKEYKSFLYFLLTSETFQEYMESHTTGTSTSHQRVKKDDILKYSLKVDREKIIKFEKIARPGLRLIQRNIEENHKLATIRDTILPKLMTGAIRVNLDGDE